MSELILEQVNILMPLTGGNFIPGSLEEIPTPNPVTNPEDDDIDIDESPYRMIIKTVDNFYFFGAPIAPREVSYSGWGLNWSEVPRDGRLPYLVMESKRLPKLSFNLLLANPQNKFWDATDTLKLLQNISETQRAIQIKYGGFFEANYLWRCTDFGFNSVYRHPETNAITQAEVDMEFTMLSDVTLTLGPVTNTPTTPKPTLPKVPPGSKTGKRKYTVKKGDTPHNLAQKFYKNVAYWRFLLDLNKIKKLPKPGKKIKY